MGFQGLCHKDTEGSGAAAQQVKPSPTTSVSHMGTGSCPGCSTFD